MTLPHTGPLLEATDLDEALAALRARGLRASASRRLVLQALFLADGPVTAERIARGLDGHVPQSDLASVYRNLETLERLGLVRHLHLGHGPGLYALAGAEKREYLVCERCQAVRGVDSTAMDHVQESIRSRFGWSASFTHFPIVGVCSACHDRPHRDQADSPTERHAHEN